MSDELTPSKRRRNLADGGYTVGLLAVAILTGYALVSPSEPARATTVARPVPVPTPGPVSDYVGRPIERAPEVPRAPEAPRVTWPKTITGQILDANRSPFEGVSVAIGGVEHQTNAEGRFTIEGH